ncbi:MAG TPA: hypothetical protein VHK65_11315 [Candidatus Dormibacteraeota bacterium]|nr:hypothetical protein [Candidatus Dormibacteraeota bacterium]
MAVRPSDVLGRMDLVIALAQSELAAQVTQESGLDTKATGLAGLAGTVVIAVLATRSSFGPAWWVPFGGFLLATILALVTLFTDPLSVGPLFPDFYDGIKTDPEETAKRKAIEDLSADIENNTRLLNVKRALLQRTLYLYAATLVISTVVLLATRG